MNNDWVNRTTRQHISGASPASMAERFGGVFNGESNADWIFNPDLSAVQAFGIQYWVITGDLVTLMSRTDMDAVNAASLSNRRDAIINELDATEGLSRALILYLLEELNILRRIQLLSNLTMNGVQTAIRQKLGS